MWTKEYESALVLTQFTEEESKSLIDLIFQKADSSIIFHLVCKNVDDEKQFGANVYSAFHTAVEACNFPLIQSWCTLENMGRQITISKISYCEFTAANVNHVPEGAEEVPWSAAWTPSLFWIVDKCDHKGIVETIVHTPGIDLDIRNENGETLLMYAVKHNNRFTVECLLEVGVDVYATDIHGKTAMRLALENEFPIIIDMIRIATFTSPTRYSRGIENMLDAIFTSEDSIRNVEVVLNEENEKCLRKLQETKMDKSSTDAKRTKLSDDETVTNSLPFEIYYRYVETYRDRYHFGKVLRLGCHRDWDFDYLYPANRFEARELLCAAVQLCQQDLVEYLVQKDPSLIFECRKRRITGSAFQEALYHDNVDALKCFLTGDDDAGSKINRDEIAFEAEDGELRRWPTSLWAAISCKEETTRTLFEVKGININAQNEEGQTVLMLLIEKMKISCIDQILKLGCDISLRDLYENTALEYAMALNLESSLGFDSSTVNISFESAKIKIIELITSAA